MKRPDLTNLRFGKWTVISKAPSLVTPSGHTHGRWLCRCDCGAEKPVVTNHLNSGRSTQCVKCQNRGRRQIPDEVIKRAKRLYGLGFSLTKVAAQLKVSRSSLTDHLKQRTKVTLWFFDRPKGRRAIDTAAELDWDAAWHRHGKRNFASPYVMRNQYWRWRAADTIRALEKSLADPVFTTAKLTSEGASAASIAKVLGVADRTVVRYRRQMPPSMPSLDAARIAAFRGRGVSWTDINETLGFPFAHGYILEAVHNWLLDRQDDLMRAA